MLGLLLSLILYGIVFGILWWFVNWLIATVPIPDPFAKIILILFVTFAVVACVGLLLQFVGVGSGLGLPMVRWG